MLAFTVRNRRLVRTDKPLPRLRPGWALIQMRLAGICNTDIEILRGYHNFRGTPGIVHAQHSGVLKVLLKA